MSTDTSKSWLLGGGYQWRILAACGLDETPTHVITLERVAPDDKPAAHVPKEVPRFSFGRLGYDISRQDRKVRAYTPDGLLRHVWGPRDAVGNEVPRLDDDAWDPVDIAGDTGYAYILDRAHQVIFLHVYGRENLSVFATSANPSSRWVRVTLDEYGCVLVFEERSNDALCFGRQGELLGTSPAEWPTEVPSIKPAPAIAPVPGNTKTHGESGYLITTPLDSGIYNCQWHRMELRLADLPPGTQVSVKAFGCANLGDAPVVLNDPRWVDAYTVVASAQPNPEDKKTFRSVDFLIPGGSGQFLGVLLELQGDGFGTPKIEGLRVHYPRETYLEYLPPLYSANEPMRVFLEGFLSIFQQEWDEMDRRVEESEGLFDPLAVPAGTAMKYLASWMSLQLEDTWEAEQNRKLLVVAPKLLSKAGTPEALRQYVSVYLANFSGLDPTLIEASAFPGIVEGFRERSSLLLNEGTAALGGSRPLWSEAVVRRLQLGGFAQAGEAALISTGNPERDFFDYFAHQFRIYVPASWVRTVDQERLLRLAIQSQIPAHVRYQLCLIQPGMVVGIQSTVGLDTILGDAPAWQLPDDAEPVPGVCPPNMLGSSVLLAGKPGTAGVVLDSTSVVGDWTLD